MSEFNIKKLTPLDWLTYKSVRLASLEDSPASFGSTYEREVEFLQSEWESRLDPTGRAKNALPLVVEIGAIPVGIAWGVEQELDPRITLIYQLWVSPEARNKGIAKALMNRISAWAIERGCEYIALSVTTANNAAVHLYQSLGFVPFGSLEELKVGSTLMTQKMIKGLRNAA